MSECFVSFSDVPGLGNKPQVQSIQERTNAALIEYCSLFYAHVADKCGQIFMLLPELRRISFACETYLLQRQQTGDLPTNTLLTEMLNSKRK